MQRIIVGINDPSRASELVDWTAHFAHHLCAPVTVLHAVHRSEMWLVASMQLDCTAYVRSYRQRLAHNVLAPLRVRDVDASTRIVFGDPARALAETAHRTGAGLILIGARTHPTLVDVVGGSVGRRLEHLTEVPLVVVPASARAAA